jgi:hypothetical protein
VRARIPEKALWQIDEDDLPTLDRPLHWTVLRGKREAIRATTLGEARELAARPRAELRSEGLLTETEPPRKGSRGSSGGKGGRKGAGKGPGKGPRPGGHSGAKGTKNPEGRSESRGNRRRQRNRKKGGHD